MAAAYDFSLSTRPKSCGASYGTSLTKARVVGNKQFEAWARPQVPDHLLGRELRETRGQRVHVERVLSAQRLVIIKGSRALPRIVRHQFRHASAPECGF